jgi:N-dimethylarginine dimethylaminohydrolase
LNPGDSLRGTTAQPAAFGGPGWSPRIATHTTEIGSLWARCGIASEVAPLEAVLLHRPGFELAVADADAALMLEKPDPVRAGQQHDALARTYRELGVHVDYVDPSITPPPNLMFVADLFFMTPGGAILARPASSVRAGEERWVARRLADIGIPILRTLSGTAVFEGADAQWLDENTVLVGRGMRTNAEGARQVSEVLRDIGINTVFTDLAPHLLHLMGQLRFLDRHLALVRRGCLADDALQALRQHGYDVEFFPDESELDERSPHNFVTLAPRTVLMPANCPVTQQFYEDRGAKCYTIEVDELARAAGGIGCLTGVTRRRQE